MHKWWLQSIIFSKYDSILLNEAIGPVAYNYILGLIEDDKHNYQIYADFNSLTIFLRPQWEFSYELNIPQPKPELNILDEFRLKEKNKKAKIKEGYLLFIPR